MNLPVVLPAAPVESRKRPYRGRRFLQIALALVALAALIAIVRPWSDGATTTTGSQDAATDQIYRQADLKSLPPTAGGPAPGVENMRAADQYAASHPDEFAGALGSGDKYILGFSNNAEDHLRRLRELVPHPDFIAVYDAEHPLSTLEPIRDRVARERTDLASDGINIDGVVVDLFTSRVQIWVIDLTPEARAALEDRFGARHIEVFNGAFGSPAH